MNNQSDLNLKLLPRVLILGQTFTTDTGGGITLGNLFKGWPKEKIAIALESKEDVNFDRADNYYRIGYKELKMPFPFYLFQRKTQSGAVEPFLSRGAKKVKGTTGLKYELKRYFDAFLQYTGLFFWMYGNQKVTSDIISWIESFKPDIIYYQPNSYKSLKFVLKIKERIKKPLISHVMDDWFSFSVFSGPFNGYWQSKINTEARQVFEVTDLHLSICDYMSQAYLIRYGYQFVAFHNSVDLNFWSYNALGSKSINTPAKLLYAGRIGYGLEEILVTIADVVEKMGNDGIPVYLEIQTKDQRHPLINTFKDYKHIATSEAIPYKQLPEKFSSADILVIPNDFTGSGVKFIRYSMPTKVSEYMATGTPVLVVAPPETALTEYAKEGWANLCASDNEENIRQAIKELIFSEKLRNQFTSKAHELVIQNHEENLVIGKFRKCLTDLSMQTD